MLLAGGSAFGLDAASGVMRWLEEHGHGLAVGPARVPIVPAAVLFDLWVGDASIRPDAAAGYAACEAAVAAAPALPRLTLLITSPLRRPGPTTMRPRVASPDSSRRGAIMMSRWAPTPKGAAGRVYGFVYSGLDVGGTIGWVEKRALAEKRTLVDAVTGLTLTGALTLTGGQIAFPQVSTFSAGR